MANEHATNRQAALDAIDEMRKAYVKVRDERDKLREAGNKLIAAVWDAHYGKGITIEYAQSVDKAYRDALGGSDQEPRCDCYPSPENWGVCRDCGKDLGDSGAVSLDPYPKVEIKYDPEDPKPNEP